MERDGRTYPWGEAAPGADYAIMDLGGRCGRTNWANSSAGPVPGEFCHTLPVGSRPKGASPYGLLDMAGNAWEWCSDWYDDTYYGRSPREDPSGPATGTFRVVRGSSWHHLPHYLKTSARFRFYPDQKGNFIGFRCARDVTANSRCAGTMRRALRRGMLAVCVFRPPNLWWRAMRGSPWRTA